VSRPSRTRLPRRRGARLRAPASAYQPEKDASHAPRARSYRVVHSRSAWRRSQVRGGGAGGMVGRGLTTLLRRAGESLERHRGRSHATSAPAPPRRRFRTRGSGDAIDRDGGIGGSVDDLPACGGRP
jgi:hypothetical protein